MHSVDDVARSSQHTVIAAVDVVIATSIDRPQRAIRFHFPLVFLIRSVRFISDKK